ncbi:hypothetical protein K3495_g4617 [Podosphaera aphanis]|nr:hypothetical protein K3495_g4617 [Podosphaera aphanis]
MLIINILFLIYSIHVSANTEKIIFLGPSKLKVPFNHFTLEESLFKLEALSPDDTTLRTHLHAQFPTEFSPLGKSSWLLLYGLPEGQKYEVRICWTATQPTSFKLEKFEMADIVEAPNLVSSISRFAAEKHGVSSTSAATISQIKTSLKEQSVSITMVRIYAAADYFTVNKTLMMTVPPVHVDIHLDPYVLNLFPLSLIPTVTYMCLLIIGSALVSVYITDWVYFLLQSKEKVSKKD